MSQDFSAKQFGAITAVSAILLLAAPAASEVQINDREGLRMVQGNISMDGSDLKMGGGDISGIDYMLEDGHGGTGIGFESYGVGIAGPDGSYQIDVRDDKVNFWSNINMSGWDILHADVIWNKGSGSGAVEFESYGVSLGSPNGQHVLEAKNYLVDIFGDLNLNGYNINDVGNCNGCDLAETVEKDEDADLEKGDVVSINDEGKLAKSLSEYDSSVAGVVSSDPVLLMGDKNGGASFGKDDYAINGSIVIETENGTKEVPLALEGLVPVKASAANGAIDPGDKLATSNVNGYAMKAEPLIERNGREVYGSGIIGKAMEPLESGQGKIQMLASIE